MAKNILVTGGMGFIGSYLVERLMEQGHDVLVIDNMTNNVVDEKHFANHLLQRCPDSTSFWSSKADVQSINTKDKSTVIDEIYHLASPVGPVGVIKHAGEIVRQVTAATYAVIDLALHHKAKLVDVSTSEVYGGGQMGLCAENMPRIIQAETTVRLEYAVAKLAMETALINLTKTTALNAVIVRPFNVAGPRQRADGGFVIPRFVGQALRGEPLTVYGDGQQIRAFTHVADIVDGLLLAMEKGTSGEVYNLGNPCNVTTINGLAEIVQNKVSMVDVQYVDPKALHGKLFAEAANKFPDDSKAIHDLGWKPMYSLVKIVRDVRDEMQRALQNSPKTVEG